MQVVKRDYLVTNSNSKELVNEMCTVFNNSHDGRVDNREGKVAVNLGDKNISLHEDLFKLTRLV